MISSPAIQLDRDLEAAEAREQKVAAGPWPLRPAEGVHIVAGERVESGWCDEADVWENQPFISEARELVPDLLARLWELRVGSLAVHLRESLQDSIRREITDIDEAAATEYAHAIIRMLGVKDPDEWLWGKEGRPKRLCR